jgi:hypothetical protein
MELRYYLLLLLLANFSFPASAAVVAVNPVIENQVADPLEELLVLDNNAIGERLGRKLTFKERIAISFLRGKLKRAKKREARRAAKGKAPPMGRDGTPIVALVCLILSLVIFPLFFPFLLLALIFSIIGKVKNRDVDPGRFRLARTCFIISLVLLISSVLLLILAAFAALALFGSLFGG